MKTHLQYESQPLPKIGYELDKLAIKLDQKHRMQRKIQFFLDIRGYLKINQILGSYVEFGVYRGEMTHCAWSVLDKTGTIREYVGLDTFEGEPQMTEEESNKNPEVQKGSYCGTYEEVSKFLSRSIGSRLRLIKGDFRENDIRRSILNKGQCINIAVIDCNLLSSIKSAAEYIMAHITAGGVLFIDDYFVNLHQGVFEIEGHIKKCAAKNGLRLIDFSTYAPVAKAFIVVK